MRRTAARFRRGLDGVDRRWKNAPIRTRLTGAAAFAATFAIVAVVAVAYIAVHHELYSNIDSQLRDQASNPRSIQIENGVPRVQKLPNENAGYAQVVDPDGSTVPESGGFGLPVSQGDIDVAKNGGSWLHTVRYQGRPLRVLTVHQVAESSLTGSTSSVALQVALPLSGVESELHKLRLAFLLLVVLGFGMATVGTSFVVRRTMRPVARLTGAAEEIARTRDLTTRIEDYGEDELGRLASTFNTMLDALERSLGQQRQLILDASHELRTPLASLRTNVEVLHDVERLSVEQRRALLDGVVTQLDELTGLVADVVELARGDAPEVSLEDVAFEDLVAHAVDRAQRHWPNVQFDYEGEPVEVRGAPARLDRAVANLLDNAGKFSPAGSAVDVKLTSRGVLTVADHGPGIPAEAIARVFDRFYRADEARALPGSGLGLSIVKQVVDGHGGSVGITNRPSGGAVVTMTIPVAGIGASDVPIIEAWQEPEPEPAH